MPYADPTVFVVDPDASVRASLESVIHRAGWTPETFASAGAFLARRPSLGPSCLLLDVALPNLAGLDLLRRLGAEFGATPVIATASQSDVPTTVRAMRAGAAEFLVKPLADDEVLAAVRHALACSRAALEREAELREFRKRHASLSGREREVMARVVAGHLNKRIAAALGISEITVKAHRGKVMRKMRSDSLAELVIMALKLGIPPLPAVTPPAAVAARTSNGATGLPDLRDLTSRGGPPAAFAAAR